MADVAANQRFCRCDQAGSSYSRIGTSLPRLCSRHNRMSRRERATKRRGMREKTVAAHRGGIKTFILPRRNAKDLAELSAVVREGMDLIQVDSLDQVLAAALLPKAQSAPVPVQLA